MGGVGGYGGMDGGGIGGMGEDIDFKKKVRARVRGADPPLDRFVELRRARVGHVTRNTLPPLRQVLHYAWNPNEDVVAVAGLNNLYIYSAL